MKDVNLLIYLIFDADKRVNPHLNVDELKTKLFCHSRISLAGIQELHVRKCHFLKILEISGFPLKTCGNDDDSEVSIIRCGATDKTVSKVLEARYFYHKLYRYDKLHELRSKSCILRITLWISI